MADLPLSSLSQDEDLLVSQLSTHVNSSTWRLQLLNTYYDGVFRVANMGISVPQQFQNVRTVIGWPRIIVDSLDERLDVEGFLFSGGTDADADLWEIWQANDLDTDSQLAHLDSLIYGSSYITVGSPDPGSVQPLISVESPLDLSVQWDARSRTMQAAFRSYRLNPLSPIKSGTLYLPDQTIQLELDQSGWQVVDRDIHNLGVVPVIRMTNRARITARNGHSEITPEIISITDAACRTLLSMEISREFFAAPQRYILGAAESAFQNADGTSKSAWETYTGMMLALEGNPDPTGQPVSVGQFPAGSPDAFTKVIDSYAKIITSITGLPSEYLGITTVNPSSADAIRMNSDRLINKVRRKQRSFEGAWEDAMRLALLIRDGSVPDDAKNMETLWRNPEIPTPVATSEALFKQAQMGSVPSTSDVVLEHLGYSAVERQRLAVDRAEDTGAGFLAELATSLEAKEARVDKSLAGDVTAANGLVPGTDVKAPVAPLPPTPPTPPAK